MFDVRCWKARPLLRIRYGMFDLKANKTGNPIAQRSLALGHGAHYQQDEVRRHYDGHQRSAERRN
jgi:hypothetical protein